MLLQPDVTILGAGIIGLSLALELHRRGARVTIYEPGAPAAQASWAAAGMLAADDPFNPPALRPLARLSAALYPAFLQQVEELSGHPVPFQTEATVQLLDDGSELRLREQSIDPRQLALALIGGIQRAGIPVHQQQTAPTVREALGSCVVIHAAGAWAASVDVSPRKGQMLRVQLPERDRLAEVYRSEHVYVVPRTKGPQAGTALIGATVENAGFNTEVFPEDLAGLRQLGAALVPQYPEIADAAKTPLVEAWAGLRPSTPDGLPLLGDLPQVPFDGDQAVTSRHLIAAGHFRNGILLAPATAVLMADLVEGRPPAVDLRPFFPARFAKGVPQMA